MALPMHGQAILGHRDTVDGTPGPALAAGEERGAAGALPCLCCPRRTPWASCMRVACAGPALDGGGSSYLPHRCRPPVRLCGTQTRLCNRQTVLRQQCQHHKARAGPGASWQGLKTTQLTPAQPRRA